MKTENKDFWVGLKEFPMDDPSSFRKELFSVPKGSKYKLPWYRSKLAKWIWKLIKMTIKKIL